MFVYFALEIALGMVSHILLTGSVYLRAKLVLKTLSTYLTKAVSNTAISFNWPEQSIGVLERQVPWPFSFLCFFHRLALKSFEELSGLQWRRLVVWRGWRRRGQPCAGRAADEAPLIVFGGTFIMVRI